jgi:hypothetical protein
MNKYRGAGPPTRGNTANASDEVRDYVRDHYILPARKLGATTVTVRAGEVHKALRWDLKRVPQVCSALATRKFLHSANVELLERKGPPSGQSTTVEFTYRLLGGDSPRTSSPQHRREPVQDGSGLEALFGIFEHEFKALGGAESFLRSERDSWGPDVWDKLGIEHRRGNAE